MNNSTSSAETPVRVVVFGGTGVQGRTVVEQLAASDRYQVSILTRNVSDPRACALAATYKNVHLIEGSYTSESGLRAAFKDQDACYFNIDSFGIGEPLEYFWTFRAYEIAVQSRLRHFIYAGAPERFGSPAFNMAERYRNSHNIVSSRLTSWLTSQPTTRLPWTILSSGVYLEMLHSLLRPRIDQRDGSANFIAPMTATSSFLLVPVENYGIAAKWALENPERSVGHFVNGGAFTATFPEIAEAFTRVTGKAARFVQVDIEAWMDGAKAAGIDPEARLPRGATSDDETSFSFRKTFGAWWALWRDGASEIQGVDGETLADEVIGKGRVRSVEEWMRRTGYDGSLRDVMKGSATSEG